MKRAELVLTVAMIRKLHRQLGIPAEVPIAESVAT